MKEELYKVLLQIYDEAKDPFSGLGILVYSEIDNLPISPLYSSNVCLSENELLGQLKELSSLNNTHHDGFHLISSNLEITHIAQYFYPKPIAKMTLDEKKGYGARYFVAKVGSALPNVLFSAVVGSNYGVCFFGNGQEVEVINRD